MTSYESKGTSSVFLLLSSPRCGSQLLTDFLDSHPDITAVHEPFQELRNCSDPIAYIDSMLDTHGDNKLVVGARYNQFTPALKGLPVIHLVRKNKALQAASQLLAGSHEVVNKLVEPPIEVSQCVFYDQVASCVKDESRILIELYASGVPYFPLSYEDMTGGVEVNRFSSQELLSFIGVSDRELTSSREKENSNQLDKLIRLVA